MKLLLSPRLSTAILSLLAIFSGVDSHTTKVRHCLTGTGFVRIFAEHWHSTFNSLQSSRYYDQGIGLNIRNDATGVSTLNSPVGLVNNVSPDDLPGCAPGVTPTLDKTYGGTSNSMNWIYFDLPYACDDSSISYTIVSSNTLLLTEASNLFPTTVAPFGGCSNLAPKPGDVVNPCAASNYAAVTLYVPGDGKCYKVEMFVGGRLYYLNREENCSSARFDARTKSPRLSQFDYIDGDTVYFKPFPNYGYTGQITFKSDTALTDVNFAMGPIDHTAKTFNIELTYPSCGV